MTDQTDYNVARLCARCKYIELGREEGNGITFHVDAMGWSEHCILAKGGGPNPVGECPHLNSGELKRRN